MKKVVFVLVGLLFFTGCSGGKSDNLKSFKDYNSKKESYQIKGTMKLVSNEDEFTYDIDVAVKNQEFYKVTLLNTINDHEQVILKNTDGVYVVTPNLNKSFRFQSEWPKNSSQAYLIESLIRDINNDTNATITEEKDTYKIAAKVNYPNNAKLDNEVITTDSKFNVKKVEVKDDKGTTMLEVQISDINYSPKFANDFFDLDNFVTETTEDDKKKKTESTCNVENGDSANCSEPTTTKKQEECLSTCKENDEECENSCKNETKSTSNILDEIIYPLYVPTDTYLSNKDTVSTDNGNRVILTFAGTDPFILVEEVAVKNNDMEIIPVSGEPLLFGGSIAALTSNSLYWSQDGVDYYLTSNTLDSNEMMTIAESITNSSTLVAKTK